MRKEWQNGIPLEKIQSLAVDIQDHVKALLDISMPIHQQEHLLHIQRAAQTLLNLATCSNMAESARKVPAHATDHPSHFDLAPMNAKHMPPCIKEAYARDKRGEVTPQASATTTEQPHRSLNILLVEDNPFTQKLMTRLLTCHNHMVTVANHGKEALEILADKLIPGTEDIREMAAFDLVLMDVRMPIMDGLETTTAIRQWENEIRQQSAQGEQKHNMRHLPIIAVTALTRDADRSHAFQVGMDGFHPKPIHADQLFAEIDRLTTGPPPRIGGDDKTKEPPAIEEKAIKTELDMAPLLKTVENDWTLLKEIVDLYCTDAPRQIQRIRNGITNNDADLVQDAAHALKGASSAFGKTPVYELALKLEQVGRARDLGQAEKSLQQLQRAVISLENRLQAEMNKNDP